MIGGHVADQRSNGGLPPRRRGRRRDARENDARLLDAAVPLAAHEGWRGLVAPRLCEVTGLSPAPVRERFHDRGELAAALWRQRLSDPFLSALAAVVAATPKPAGGEAKADPEPMLAALAPFQEPDDILRAAIELIIMGRFEPLLGEAIAQTWQGWASSWLRPEPGGLTAAQAARNGYSLLFALGLLLTSRGVPMPLVNCDNWISAMVRAMASDAQPQSVLAGRAEHLDLGAVFNTDDPVWDALLQATLDEVGSRGYDGATLERIAHRAGYSRGIIQSRYETKKEVFLDATRRMLAEAVALNGDYSRRISEQYGGGMADAALLREFMEPDRRLLRAIAMEQIRMAWHDPDMAAVMRDEAEEGMRKAEIHTAGSQDAMASARSFGWAGGQGSALLADLEPGAYALPYDVVTVPLDADTGSWFDVGES